MSLFFGKNGAKGVLHMTKGEHSEADMKGAFFSDSIFHSALPYVQVLGIYSLVRNSTSPRAFYLENELLDYLVDGYSALIIGRNAEDPANTYRFVVRRHEQFGEYYLSSYILYPQYRFAKRPDESLAYLDPNTEIFPTTTSRYLLLGSSVDPYDGWTYNNTTEIKMVILSIKNGVFKPIQKLDESVSINRNEFKVGSLDMTSTMFLHSEVINGLDLKIFDNGFTYQIINSYKVTNSPVQIESKGGRSVIKHGNKIIATTEVNDFRFRFSSLISHTYPFGWAVPGEQTRTLVGAGSFQANDIFMTTFDYNNKGNRGMTTRPLSFYRFIPGTEYMVIEEIQVLEDPFNWTTSLVLGDRSYIKCNSNGSLTLRRSIFSTDPNYKSFETVINIVHFD